MERRKETKNTPSINDETVLTVTKSLECTKHFWEKKGFAFFSQV